MRIEATGKNVEIAIQNGLLECGLRREDVEVTVLDEGGLFKKAKVVLTEKRADQTVSEADSQIETKSESEDESQVSEITMQETEHTESSAPVEKKAKRVVDTARLRARGEEFLSGLAHLVDPDATVESTVEENAISFSIKGENVGKLIGYHGENIQALQMILSGLKNRGEGAIRLYLDIDGYKSNRNQSIIELALKTAEQAVKIERNIHLDPMNAYDRRIVHTTLQNRDDVTTESTGEGEKRHVVIKPIFKR